MHYNEQTLGFDIRAASDAYQLLRRMNFAFYDVDSGTGFMAVRGNIHLYAQFGPPRNNGTYFLRDATTPRLKLMECFAQANIKYIIKPNESGGDRIILPLVSLNKVKRDSDLLSLYDIEMGDDTGSFPTKAPEVNPHRLSVWRESRGVPLNSRTLVLRYTNINEPKDLD